MSDEWIPYEEFCDMVSENARAKHKVYLNSDEWKKKREFILERDNYLCQDCLNLSPMIFKILIKKIPFLKDISIDTNIKAAQVHHLNYNSLHTPQEINDCISLCEFCHKIKHSGLKYDYKKNVEKRNQMIENIILLRLEKHPLILELKNKIKKEFIKSLTLKPNDWLKQEYDKDKGDANGKL